MKIKIFAIIIGIIIFSFSFNSESSAVNAQQCGSTTTQAIGSCDTSNDGCKNGKANTITVQCSGVSCTGNYQNAHCVFNWDPVKLKYFCQAYLDTATITCGAGTGGGDPNCTNPKDQKCCSCAQTSCTPVCPAGTTATNNGLPVVSVANCSHHNGGCNKNWGCISIGTDINCYYDDADTSPVSSIITGMSGTSPVSCTAQPVYSGKQVNNTISVKTTYVDTNSNNSPVALMSWFGLTTPPTVTNIANTGGTSRLANNNSFGIMVKKNAAGAWSNLYVPGFAPVKSVLQYSWVNTGPIDGADIIGSGGKKLATVSNVKVTSTANANPVTTTYDAENLPNLTDLVAHWGFDQTNATNTGNPGGNCDAACIGTLNSFNSPTGPDNSATSGWTTRSELWKTSSLLFDGIDDYISLPTPGTLSGKINYFKFSTAVTISVWAKVRTMPAAGQRSTILNIFDGSGAAYSTALRLSFFDTNKIEFVASDKAGEPVNVATAAVSNTDEWHYYVGVADWGNHQMLLYVDGTLVATVPANFPQSKYIDTGGVPALGDSIGAVMTRTVAGAKVTIKPADFFAGEMDSLALFKRAMTPAEIKGLYGRYVADAITLSYDIQFYNEDSGVASYEKVTDGSYHIYAAGMTSATLLAGQTAFNTTETWTNLGLDHIIDLTDPVNDSLTTSASGSNSINLAWKFSDGLTPIHRVSGDASTNGGPPNGPIDDNTSGTIGYNLNSGDTADLFASNHLWKALTAGTTSLSRTENINLRSNTESIIYSVTAFDSACNYITVNKTLGSTAAADPWILTKAGLVYTAGGSIFTPQSFATHTVFGPESYWSTPSNIYKDEADLTTELLESGGAFTPLVNAVKLGSASIANYTDVNNKHGYWFTKLSSTLDARVLANASNYTIVTQPTDYTLPAKVTSVTDGSNTCTNAKDCVVKVTGNMIVPSNFSCDGRVTFLVKGDITVNPDVTNSGPSYGCIFVSSNNLTIGAGTYKSGASAYPLYDLLDGYYIADNAILIPAADVSQSMKDGLKVTGGLIAFGSSTSTAFVMGRDLAAFNNNYPALVIHNDNRFLTIGAEMIGSMQDLYKQEVGFKPL